ncbi:hypothetical protein THAOC_17977, partial [Thalassiosira oceanica]
LPPPRRRGRAVRRPVRPGLPLGQRHGGVDGGPERRAPVARQGRREGRAVVAHEGQRRAPTVAPERREEHAVGPERLHPVERAEAGLGRRGPSQAEVRRHGRPDREAGGCRAQLQLARDIPRVGVHRGPLGDIREFFRGPNCLADV